MNCPLKTLILCGALIWAAAEAGAATASRVEGRGDVSAPFLAANPSVRAAALGGFQATSAGDVDASFSNPATLTSLALPELWLTHTDSFVDTQFQTAAFGLPGKKQAGAFAIQYLNDGAIERTGIDGANQPVVGLGDFRPYIVVGQGSWARSLPSAPVAASAGLTLKVFHQSLDQTSMTGWALDGGLHFPQLLPGLSGGLVYRNLGPSQNGFPLPQSLAAGVAYDLGVPWPVLRGVSIFNEYDAARESDNVLRAGIEMRRSRFWLRGGYASLESDDSDALSRLGFGGGFRLKGWRLDYAWLPRGDLGDQHRVGLTIGFGLTAEEREQAARDVDRRIRARMADYVRRHLASGRAAAAAADYLKAVEEFEQALRWDPDDQTVQAELSAARRRHERRRADDLHDEAGALAKRGEWIDAAYHWKQALKLVPDHAEAKAALAGAEREIARRRDGDNGADEADAAFNTGVLFYLDGDYAAALEHWNDALARDPGRSQLREYVAKAKANQLARELDQLRAARPSPDERIETLSQQAYTFYSLGYVEEAVSTWKRILALSPGNEDAAWALREIDEEGGRSADGRSRSVEELNTSALRLYGAGELDKAITAWRRAQILAPHNVKIKNNLKRAESERAARRARPE